MMVLAAENFFSGLPTSREERDFWRDIRLHDRLYKTTGERRMEDLDALVIKYWKGVGFEPGRVLDAGASSGITSLEWLETMQVAGFDPQMIGTDIALKAMILRALPFHRILVRDTQNMEPLQHAFFGWVVRPYITGRKSWITTPIANLLYKILFATRFPFVIEKSVMLVSPRCATNKKLTFIEDDLFNSHSKMQLGKFDVIRTANLLSPYFFSREKLEHGLRNIKAMLNGPGSFLIVNLTEDDGSNNGTMFRFEPDGHFQSVVAIGKGSEITNLVLSV